MSLSRLSAPFGGYLAASAVTVVASLAVPSSAAAAPANDDLANARSLALGSVTLGTTVGATRQRFEPVPGSGGTVWYKLRAPRATTIALNTCATRSDLPLGAYDGTSIKTLRTISEDYLSQGPWRGGFFGSRVSFAAEAGKTYRIGVGAYTRRKAGRFNLVVAEVAAFPNDAFARPRSLRVGGRIVQSNELATAEAGEPANAGAPAAQSLWFKFRPRRTGRVRLATEGSSFDTRIGVYRGTAVARLQRVASNDDATRRTVSSAVVFRARRGLTYRIAVDGIESRNAAGAGDVVLTLARA